MLDTSSPARYLEDLAEDSVLVHPALHLLLAVDHLQRFQVKSTRYSLAPKPMPFEVANRNYGESSVTYQKYMQRIIMSQ